MYCRQLRVNNRALFKAKGPLLLACNHPNSFLDAIILASLFKRPVYSLARGDAFKNNFFAWILKSLKMFPVYRTSEGTENMEHNYSTFEACKEIFKKNGIVLIFSEGRCINEWHLRPLKKGTARLAISSWKDGIDLTVLPVGINYQSFRTFGKNIHLYFGKLISKNDIDHQNGFGKSVQSFNQLLLTELQPLVYEIGKDDLATRQKYFKVNFSFITKIFLAIPALLGYFIHLPLYYPAKIITVRSSNNNDHYDSILVGILFVAYPLYLALVGSLINKLITASDGWLIFIMIPFCAWSCLQLKRQF
jgi:1-acyl-sn-glycerol-3-phosphate acyltransferase